MDKPLIGFLFEAQLAAGGIDVVALFQAQGGGDSGALEGGEKRTAVALGRALPLQPIHRVVGNEIDLGMQAAGVAS